MTDTDRPLNLDAETSFERDGCAHTALICMNCQREQHNAETLLAERDALIAELRAAQAEPLYLVWFAEANKLKARAEAAEKSREAAVEFVDHYERLRDVLTDVLNCDVLMTIHRVARTALSDQSLPRTDIARLKRVEAAANYCVNQLMLLAELNSDEADEYGVEALRAALSPAEEEG